MNPALPAAPAPFRVCGIAGSLRAASYNRALLRAAQELAPAHWVWTVVDLAPLPLYDADVEAAGAPEPVAALKRALRSADALLIATPGSWGTARSQAMLRQVLAGTLTPALLAPEVYVARAGEKFDAAGRLTDEPTREHLRKFLLAFEAWVRGQAKA